MDDLVAMTDAFAADAEASRADWTETYLSRYSTPSTPISIDLPSMTPTVSTMDSHQSKRQRTISFMDDVGRQRTLSFEVAYPETDFQQIWESFDHTDVLASSLMFTGLPASVEVEVEVDEMDEFQDPTSLREPQIVETSRTSSKPPRNSRRSGQKRLKKKSHTAPVAYETSVIRPSPRLMNQILPSRCTAAQRREKVTRYLEKRKRRVWRKEVKYSCRKQFAESRPRVAGRFIPKHTLSETELNFSLDDFHAEPLP